MPETALALPWHIQVALGSGYMAYVIAYAGVRQHHTAADAAFRSAAFGLVATAALLWLPAPAILRAAAGVIGTVAAGAFWRWRGMRWAQAALRRTNVSWADDIPSAWLTITAQRTDLKPSQIAVDLTDGRTLLSEDTRAFRDSPFGPCVFGLDGSLALYVTAERDPAGNWVEHEDVRHLRDGDKLTFVPASSIRRVEIRHWRKANATAELEETKGSVAAEEL